MRIAVLTNTVATTGGAGTIAKTYNELLAARGHEIRVWGPCDDFRSLGKMNLVSRLAFHLRDLGARDATAREILDWKPDALLTHNLTGCGFATPKKISRKGIRWVHVLHDVQLIEPSGQIRVDGSYRLRSIVYCLWRRFWSFLRRQEMGEPDAVVSPTKWLLEFHQKFGWFTKTRAEVIPNPAPPPVSPSFSAEGGGITNPLLSMNRRGLGVVYVGRVDRDKGILVLLDAWKKMNAPTSRLVVIGDGRLLESLKSRNIPGIEFRGSQSPEDVRRAMEESAVVVVPSLVLENQPTVILEALAAGCGVVASDVGGVRETLDGAGVIVPPGDADALAKAIMNIVGAQFIAPKTKGVINHAPTSHVLSRHDPDVCADRLIGVLRSNL